MLRIASLAAPALALAVCLFGAGCSSNPPLPPKAIALNEAGAVALAAGDFETAEARLALALEYHPRFTEAWVNRGLLSLQKGDLDAAEKSLRHARDLNPDLPAPHHSLGLLAEARHEAGRAEGAYRAALRVDPGFAPARINLGRILFARGEFEDAREQFVRATEVAPEVVESWSGLVESLLKVAREEDADAVLARARRLHGDAPALALLVGRGQLRRGLFVEAEASFAPLTGSGDRSLEKLAWKFISVARRLRRDDAGAQAALAEAAYP